MASELPSTGTDAERTGESPPPPKGLWALMARAESTESAAEPEEKSSEGDDSTIAADAVEDSGDAGDAPSVASGVQPPGRRVAEAESEPIVPRKSLWALMGMNSAGAGTQEAAAVARPPEVVETPAPPADAGSGDEALSAEADDDDEDDFSVAEFDDVEVAAVTPLPPIEPLFPPRTSAQPRRLERGAVSCLSGAAAVGLSALALLPEVWWKFPATLVGLSALILGFSAVNDANRRCRREQETAGVSPGLLSAWLGIVLGTAGILLGPLVFAGIGQDLRRAFGRRGAKANLETIGAGLNAHHDEHAAFPPGGVFRADKNGNDRPLHGWMTFLLPYVGEEALYRSIDLDRPYTDDVNFPAMGRDVSVFFAPGSSRDKVGPGFAVSHFAGVGGDVIDPEIGLVHLGIFGRNSRIRRGDVTDGLTQTLVAGEIAHRFPAWGEPSNWRSLGKGLNQNPQGFGNADGSGAMFLHADGSVRFYSNQVSPRILQHLGTRDGGEVVRWEDRAP